MAITKHNAAGFDAAELETYNGAELHAKLRADNTGAFRGIFEVVTKKKDMGQQHTGGGGWYFDEGACREAAEFFTELANELKRRNS